MKKFSCELIKMARYGNEKTGYTLDPDNQVVVWVKKIESNGIMKTIKKLNSNHKSFELLKNNIDKLNPNHYRCNISEKSNYYSDLTGFSERENEELSVGMVMLEIYEIRLDENDKEIANHGYQNEPDWY